jgi:hypothetical protein
VASALGTGRGSSRLDQNRHRRIPKADSTRCLTPVCESIVVARHGLTMTHSGSFAPRYLAIHPLPYGHWYNETEVWMPAVEAYVAPLGSEAARQLTRAQTPSIL